MNIIKTLDKESSTELLTREYGQFIMDRKSVPNIELLESNDISLYLLNSCYEDAQKQLKELHLRKFVILFSSYKEKSSIFSFLPLEIFSHIFQMKKEVDCEADIEFLLFNNMFKNSQEPSPQFKYFSMMKDKFEDVLGLEMDEQLFPQMKGMLTNKEYFQIFEYKKEGS